MCPLGKGSPTSPASSTPCLELVLNIDRERLVERLERACVRRVGALVAELERLWDKYRVSLKKIEGRRSDAATRLDGYLLEFGYAPCGVAYVMEHGFDY